jgi:predicted transcriptional regulator
MLAKKTMVQTRATMAAPTFTFLTNHSHVLICLAENPALTVREAALRVGITERAVLGMIKDLTTIGVITIQKEGRRNRYLINPQVHLRHAIEQHKTVGDLVRSILGNSANLE